MKRSKQSLRGRHAAPGLVRRLDLPPRQIQSLLCDFQENDYVAAIYRVAQPEGEWLGIVWRSLDDPDNVWQVRMRFREGGGAGPSGDRYLYAWVCGGDEEGVCASARDTVHFLAAGTEAGPVEEVQTRRLGPAAFDIFAALPGVRVGRGRVSH